MHKVSYFQDVAVEDVPDGRTILEVSIKGRIPHLHQCGGRGRCTTCRVQIMDGLSQVSARNAIEEKVAALRGWDEFTRLACQTKVHGDVIVRRLLTHPQDIIVLDLDELHGMAPGEGKELDLAILFADIRNFTTHSEKSLPFDVVHMLNRHFTAMAEPVLNNNGFIDKYIGDGVLAVFGTRGESPMITCQNAVRAALEMQEAAERLHDVFEQEFHASLQIGVGIHFGTVILGRIGHPGKRQITVIGDTVNMASRIEGMTKELNAAVLVSESVANALPNGLRLGSPTEVKLKGRKSPALVYSCEGFREPDPVFLVQKSFDRISARSKEFGERFYVNLFEAHPELRPLFNKDLTVQTKMIFSMLSSIVKGLNRMEEIKGGLRELGRRHRDYKTSRFDYDKVVRALCKTLEECLGDEFTPEIRQAWISIYGQITEVMIDAAEG